MLNVYFLNLFIINIYKFCVMNDFFLEYFVLYFDMLMILDFLIDYKFSFKFE